MDFTAQGGKRMTQSEVQNERRMAGVQNERPLAAVCLKMEGRAVDVPNPLQQLCVKNFVLADGASKLATDAAVFAAKSLLGKLTSSDSEESFHKDLPEKIRLKVGMQITVLLKKEKTAYTLIDFGPNKIVAQSHSNDCIMTFGMEELRKWSTVTLLKHSRLVTFDFDANIVWVKLDRIKTQQMLEETLHQEDACFMEGPGAKYQLLVSLFQNTFVTSSETQEPFSSVPKSTGVLSCPICKGNIVLLVPSSKKRKKASVDIVGNEKQKFYHGRVDWHMLTPESPLQQCFIENL